MKALGCLCFVMQGLTLHDKTRSLFISFSNPKKIDVYKQRTKTLILRFV